MGSMIINDYQWLSMIINDYQWLSMIINDYQWLSMIINGYPWVNGYPWLSMVINQWLSINGYRWLLVGTAGYWWLSWHSSLRYSNMALNIPPFINVFLTYGCVWKCCVPLNPMVLLIIIPIKWLFHWEYTLFSDKPYQPPLGIVPAMFDCLNKTEGIFNLNSPILLFDHPRFQRCLIFDYLQSARFPVWLSSPFSTFFP